MSRHREIRNMNYNQFDDGYDDELSDDYGYSPGTTPTSAMYLVKRDANGNVIKDSEQLASSPLKQSSLMQNLDDQHKIQSVLDVVGDDVDEGRVIEALAAAGGSVDDAINYIFDHPKGAEEEHDDYYEDDDDDDMFDFEDDEGFQVPVKNNVKNNQAQAKNQSKPSKIAAKPKPAAKAAPAPRAYNPDAVKTAAVVMPKKTKTLTITPAKKSKYEEKKLSSGIDGLGLDEGGNADYQADDDDLMGGEMDENDMPEIPMPEEEVVEEKKTSEKKKFVIPKGVVQRATDYTDQIKEALAAEKVSLNLVVIGHVDAGKSTLTGHLLYKLGTVSQSYMHKMEKESERIGKSSFKYAWLVDENTEERERGVTMDIALTTFEIESRRICLRDAPGHKDFIPAMITGTAAADVAILVVSALTGEFEAGFGPRGQTREHAVLAKSLGVISVVVAVNKLDACEWSRSRYEEIREKMGQFLGMAGFKPQDIIFVPVSGLSGINLTPGTSVPELSKWYNDKSIVDVLNTLQPASRSIDTPFRAVITDVFKTTGLGATIAAKIESGSVGPADKVLLVPNYQIATVKAVTNAARPNSVVALAGDTVELTASNIDWDCVAAGHFACAPEAPILVTNRFKAQVVVLSAPWPFMRGFSSMLHYQTSAVPCVVTRIVSTISRSSGKVLQKKPRTVEVRKTAVVEILANSPLPLEPYASLPALGRFLLRHEGQTVAAGIVTKVYQA